jgi:hypothetical protein
MILPSILSIFLFVFSIQGASNEILKSHEVCNSKIPEQATIGGNTAPIILDLNPSFYYPVKKKIEAIGLITSMLHFCIGENRKCLEDQFKRASKNNPVFANFLNKTLNRSGTIGDSFLNFSLYAWFVEWMEKKEDLDIEIRIILSLFLIKLEGDESDGKRIYFHICFLIKTTSSLSSLDLEIFELLLKYYFVDQNEELFLQELQNPRKNRVFLSGYNKFLALYPVSQVNLDMDHLLFFKHFKSALPTISCLFDFGKDRSNYFRRPTIDMLYKHALQVLLIDRGSLYKFVSKELIRYLEPLEIDIREAIMLSQAIEDERVTELIFRRFPSNKSFFSSPFNYSGNGYLLSKHELDILFKFYYVGFVLKENLSFPYIFSMLNFQYPEGYPMGIEGIKGDLQPIFIISFDFIRCSNFKQIPLFNFHFCTNGNEEEVTFSIRDPKLLEYPGMNRYWGKIIGNFLFVCDMTFNTSDRVLNRLNKLVLKSSPFLYYELLSERVSLFKIINHSH